MCDCMHAFTRACVCVCVCVAQSMIRTLGTIAGEFIQVRVGQSPVPGAATTAATRATDLLPLLATRSMHSPRPSAHVSRVLSQMGVEDIASTHRRSVDAIRADIAKAQK